MPNSTPDEAGEEPSELAPVLSGEGRPNPRPLTPPPFVPVNTGLFNPDETPNSGAVGPLLL